MYRSVHLHIDRPDIQEVLDLRNMHTNILFQFDGNSSAPELPLRKLHTGLWFTAIAMMFCCRLLPGDTADFLQRKYRLYVSLGQEQGNVRYQTEGRD